MQSTQYEDEQKGLDLQFQSTYPLIRDDRPDQPNEVIPETECQILWGKKPKCGENGNKKIGSWMS